MKNQDPMTPRCKLDFAATGAAVSRNMWTSLTDEKISQPLMTHPTSFRRERTARAPNGRRECQENSGILINLRGTAKMGGSPPSPRDPAPKHHVSQYFSIFGNFRTYAGWQGPPGFPPFRRDPGSSERSETFVGKIGGSRWQICKHRRAISRISIR